MKLSKIFEFTFIFILLTVLVSDFVIAGSCETDHRILYCNRNGNPHKEECHTDNNCDNGAECDWSFCAGGGGSSTTTTVPETTCNAIYSISVSKSNLNPSESFTCSVTTQRGNEPGIHCGISKNDQWVTGCDFTHWSGNTAKFTCVAPSQPDQYKVVGYNYECTTPDKVTWITVHSITTTTVQSQCPFDSTQARFHTNSHTRLESYLTVDFGEQVKSVGVHNQNTGSAPWNDINLRITGPNGFVKTCDVQCWFTPPYSGTYSLHVTSDVGTGSKCEDWATLVVREQSQPTTTTTIPTTTTTTIPQYCTPKWQCDGNWQYYLNQDCSKSNWNYCTYRCQSGQCLSQPTTTTTTIPQQNYCYLDIFVWDEDYDEINANIYVDGSYKGYDDHLNIRVDEGSHTVKAEKSKYQSDQEYVSCWNGETKRVNLYLEYNEDNYDINVKDIVLDPEFPKRCEIVLVTVPIELKEAENFPQDVYVKAYIDSNLEYTTTIRYYDEETRVFKFSFDTCNYNIGTHSIRVEARIDSVSDSSYKSFTITDDHLYPDYKNHCLDVEKIWTNKPIQPDEDVRVYVKITNCGTETESEIRGNLEAFGFIVSDGMFNLPEGGSQEVSFNLHIPEAAAGTESFVVRFWNRYTSDILIKDFVVYTGIPIIEIEPVQKVQKGKLEKIEFDVINVGDVTDTFSLELSGYASNWMTGLSPEITLEPDQRKTVEVYVNVPEGVGKGDYQFTVSSYGSPRYAVTSTLRVVDGFNWNLLTGMFVIVGWLPWLLLLLLALLLFLLWFLFGRRSKRSGGAEGDVKRFFKFDDCC